MVKITSKRELLPEREVGKETGGSPCGGGGGLAGRAAPRSEDEPPFPPPGSLWHFTAPCRLHEVLEMIMKDMQLVPSPQAFGNHETLEHQL